MKNYRRSLLRGLTVTLLIGLLMPAVNAQETGEVLLDIPAGAMAGPNFNVDTATEAYINLLSEEQRESSDSYFEGGYWLQLWGFLYGLAVAWLLLGTRLSARMRNLSERFGRWRWLQTFLYGAQYVVVATF